jgi:hypothetical protein
MAWNRLIDLIGDLPATEPEFGSPQHFPSPGGVRSKNANLGRREGAHPSEDARSEIFLDEDLHPGTGSVWWTANG